MKATQATPEITAAIATFVAGCQAIVDGHQSQPGFPEGLKRTLAVRSGPRYAKVVNVEARDGRDGSVYAFVDLSNGDVLKPATWRAPAKHARGNVLDEHNGLQHMGAYGPARLR